MLLVSYRPSTRKNFSACLLEQSVVKL